MSIVILAVRILVENEFNFGVSQSVSLCSFDLYQPQVLMGMLPGEHERAHPTQTGG